MTRVPFPQAQRVAELSFSLMPQKLQFPLPTIRVEKPIVTIHFTSHDVVTKGRLRSRILHLVIGRHIFGTFVSS